MKWEVPLLLGFLLFFSTWVSLPVTSNYYFDSNNVKHYLLTPAWYSYGNDVDNLTNVLFIKYDNPWQSQSETAIALFTGILLLFQVSESVQLYLRQKILSKLKIQRCLDLFLDKCHNLNSIWDHDDSQHYALTLALKNHFFKIYKIKKFKVFPVIFFTLLLFSFFPHDVYAATAQFSDGSQLTGLSTNCAARSTIGTLSTSLPAASSSIPNIIIATTDYVSSDAGNELVQTSSGIYRSSSQLVGSQYTFYIGAVDEGNHYTYLYEDPSAGASPTYTVEGCLSATAGNAESKILAIQGLESSFTDSANVATTAGSFVTIATLITDLTANNHIVIAQVQIDFDGTGTIAAGEIELRDSADTMLTESQFEIRGGNNTPGDGSTITLIALVPAGSANTSYKIAVMEPAGGGVAGAEAKILAIKANGGEGYFSDGSSVAVGASATQLTSLTTSFSSDENVVVMSASQFDDTDSVTESLVITSGHEIRENSVAKSGNQMTISEPTASGNAGEGIRHSLIWYGTVGAASLGYDSRATASATGYNGESKLLAFSIRENLLPSDTSILSESVTLKQKLVPSDTPTLSESTTLKQKLFPADTPTLSENVTIEQKIFPSDIPTLSDSATMKQKLFPSDTPSFSDSATVKQKIFPDDTPTLSDSVTIMQSLFPVDTPTFSDSATAFLIHILSADDIPTLDESVVIKQSLFPDDTPTLSDLATAFLIQALSADDTPTLDESVILKQSLFPVDTPMLSDSATASLIQGLDTADTPNLSEFVTIKQILLVDDIPSISDSVAVLLIQNLDTNDIPSLSEATTAFLIQGFDISDTPALSESVIIKQDLFPNDTLSINDLAFLQKKTIATGGGNDVDNTPPSIVSSSITSLDAQNQGSVIILGENNDLEGLSQSRPIKVGEVISLRFEINEPGGIDNIEHASLYIDKGNLASDVSQSNTFIRFEKGKPFEINDPNKLFSDVSLAILTKDTTNFVFRFDITFEKSMEPSSILFRTWDLARNSNQIWYLNALGVVDSTSLPAIPQVPTQEPIDNNESIKTMTPEQKLLIEKWSGYNLESISDSKLLRLLGIIPPQTENEISFTIQPWFRNNVGTWLLEGKVSFTEFLDALEYMYEKGILR